MSPTPMQCSSSSAADAHQLLADCVVQRLRRLVDAPVLLDDLSAQWQTLTASQLLYRAVRIAACMRHAGCKPGDTVLLFSELRPDAVCILVAGLLAGIRVAVLPHTSDLRELNHALHAAQPVLLMFISELSTAVASACGTARAHPQLQRPLVIGDEFLGRSSLASFNVFVRNARVADIGDARAFVPQLMFSSDHAKTAAPLLMMFTCDAIGRFKADTLSADELLGVWRPRCAERDTMMMVHEPLRISDVGLSLSKPVVERIVRHLAGVEVVGAKL